MFLSTRSKASVPAPILVEIDSIVLESMKVEEFFELNTIPVPIPTAAVPVVWFETLKRTVELVKALPL